MERRKIERAFHKFMAEYPFFRIEGEPHCVNAAPGEIKFLSAKVLWYGHPLTLYIVPQGNMNLFHDPYAKIYIDKRQKQSQQNSFFHLPCLVTHLPEHLYQAKTIIFNEDNVDVLLYERPIGDHIIPLEKFKDPAVECAQEIMEFAILYWNSQSLFWDTPPEFKVADYFLRRFKRWKNYVKTHSDRLVGYSDFVAPDCMDRLLLRFLTELPEKLLNSSMEMTWNLLGTTDTVVVDGSYPWKSKCYLQNVHCEPRPIGFGPAACIWNMILYGWNKSPDEILEDVIIYEGIFANTNNFYLSLNNYDLYHAGFKANLFERLYAALMIDLPYCRSPYNKPGTQNDPSNIRSIMNTVENVLHVIRYYFEK